MMSSDQSRHALVVTSIFPPNAVMEELAAGARAAGWDFVIAGDGKSPADYRLDGARFLSLDDQLESGFALAGRAPVGSYTRKNLGYLAALRAGADIIVETDDDNHPSPGFWVPRRRVVHCARVVRNGWVNAYRYFTDDFIYPRGLPLAVARDGVPAAAGQVDAVCPVQQGLADQDPDVDAVYRMLYPLPLSFRPRGPVRLDPGAWCPFNSQNTTFFRDAFPLMFLPAKCSFRMTDIWRSFVAQRVLHALGFGVLFHQATVWQERNAHDIHKDFLDELPGYTHNAAIREALLGVDLKSDMSMRNMMEHCYQALMENGWIGREEESLLGAWFDDLEVIGCRGPAAS